MTDTEHLTRSEIPAHLGLHHLTQLIESMPGGRYMGAWTDESVTEPVTLQVDADTLERIHRASGPGEPYTFVEELLRCVVSAYGPLERLGGPDDSLEITVPATVAEMLRWNAGEENGYWAS